MIYRKLSFTRYFPIEKISCSQNTPIREGGPGGATDQIRPASGVRIRAGQSTTHEFDVQFDLDREEARPCPGKSIWSLPNSSRESPPDSPYEVPPGGRSFVSSAEPVPPLAASASRMASISWTSRECLDQLPGTFTLQRLGIKARNGGPPRNSLPTPTFSGRFPACSRLLLEESRAWTLTGTPMNCKRKRRDSTCLLPDKWTSRSISARSRSSGEP